MSKRRPVLEINNDTDLSNPSATSALVIDQGSGTHNHDTDYVSIASGDTITGTHNFDTGGVIFTIATNSRDILVDYLNADKLDGQHGTYYATQTDMDAAELDIDNLETDVTALKAVPYVTIGNTATTSTERNLAEGLGINITDGGANGSATIVVDLAEITGTGLTVVSNQITMPVPTTLNTTTTNQRSATDHTHAITTTVAGVVSTIVATNANGATQLAGLGIGTTPLSTYPLLVDSTAGNQVRIRYDATKHLTIDVDSSGNAQFTAIGNLILKPTTNFINPDTPYARRLGDNANKYLAIDVASLNVTTLVSETEVTSAGGGIYVAESTQLAADINNSVTTITIKDNNVAVGM